MGHTFAASIAATRFRLRIKGISWLAVFAILGDCLRVLRVWALLLLLVVIIRVARRRQLGLTAVDLALARTLFVLMRSSGRASTAL